MNDNILQELKKPFHPSVVTWKPQATTKDGAKAMAAAYADLRAYQDRLDEVCGMGWSVSYTPWGDRIICHVTINGVTRSSSGEGDSQSERSEIAGTAAEAQAFKRACAMFGLGRYLYSFPTTWVEFDASKKQFADAGRKKLDSIIIEHYNRHMKETAAVEAPANGNGHAPHPAILAEPPPEEEEDNNPFTANGVGALADKREQHAAMVEKAAYWRKLDDSADPCSEAQYGYFVSVVEAVTGKGTHERAFFAMFKRKIDVDNRPGKQSVKWLLDVLPESVAQKDENNKPVKNEAGKNVYVNNAARDMMAVGAVKTLYAGLPTAQQAPTDKQLDNVKEMAF